MIEKLEKLVDIAILGAIEFRNYYASMNNGELPLDKKVARTLKDAEALAPGVVKERKPRAAPAKTAAEAESPFGAIGDTKAEPAAAASIEDQTESKRRCQEVMGLFIRRYLKAQPTGLDRAKGILTQVCGRSIAKLEDLTHADNVKLIPVFEAELEKAA